MVLGLVAYETVDMVYTVLSLTLKGASSLRRWWWRTGNDRNDDEDDGCARERRELLDRIRRLEERVMRLEGGVPETTPKEADSFELVLHPKAKQS